MIIIYFVLECFVTIVWLLFSGKGWDTYNYCDGKHTISFITSIQN